MKKVTKALIIIAALLLLIAAGVLTSRYMLQTTEYTVVSSRLPESFDGFRIVQVSDLHGCEFGEGNERLLSAIRDAKPDIIAITGDMADENTDMAVIDRFLAGAADIAPVYYVSGNHEWWARCIPELEVLFEEYGVHYLRNEYEVISLGGESIVIAGAEDPNGPADMLSPENLVDIINSNENEPYTVLLGHRNYWVEEYPELEVDIILSGHAHGGIVRLPFLGGVLGSGFRLFPDFTAGVYESGRYSMIVSRGLGNSVVVPRFMNRPELVAVTLKKQ